jgi:hypothetical protein
MHSYLSQARGDQLHLALRMRGSPGPRLEILSTSVPGSVRTAEQGTGPGRNAISMPGIRVQFSPTGTGSAKLNSGLENRIHGSRRRGLNPPIYGASNGFRNAGTNANA